jgi:SAM-dependent methyltransferase
VDHTLSFVLGVIGMRASRILEIGSGSGALAARLASSGHRVVALDSSLDAVLEARSRGVDARHIVWPHFYSDPFDFVLFTRSLHHIGPLDQSLLRASEVLIPEGRVFVEDFAFHAAGRETIQWFRDHLEELRGEITGDRQSFACRILDARDPISEWAHDADHIHSAEVIYASLSEVFEIEMESAVPYLYRYLEPLLPVPRLAEFADAEKAAIAHGSIRAIGRRYVARQNATPSTHLC